MKKAVAVLLVITFLFPSALFAAADGVPSQPAGKTPSAPATTAAARDSDYSATAEKAYLGTAIGTLVGGGAFIALGVSAGNSHEMASDAAATGLYIVGGAFLVASTVLWTLYFREKGKEPAAAVGLELNRGKGVVVAKFRF
jgi:hypothetical protein